MALRLGEDRYWTEEEAEPVYCETIPEETSGTGAEILIMSVDFGDGRSGRVIVRENDDATVLAREFCLKQGLPMELVTPLREQIVTNVVKLGVMQGNVKESRKNGEKSGKKKAVPVVQRKSPERKYARPSSSTGSASRPHPTNPGERLYSQSHHHNRETDRQRLLTLQKTLQTEDSDLTFHPKLNEHSLEMAGKRRRRGSVDVLHSARGSRQESVERMKKEGLEKEKSECTFKPEIDPISQILASGMRRSSSAERYVQLHQDAERRKHQQAQVAHSYVHEICPFQPTLVAKQLITNEPPMHLRLIPTRKQTAVQPEPPGLYRPRTGRSPKQARKAEHTPIGDYLYSLRPKPQLPPPKEAPVPTTTNDTSQRLLHQKRLQRYKQIFSLLHPDDKMEISYEHVRLNELDKNLLALLKPLLEEMEGLKVTLNFGEFEEAMDALVKTMHPGNKAKLLGYGKKEVRPGSDVTHRPQVTGYKCSERVQRLLQIPLYDRWKESRKDVQSWLETERQRKAELELEECSFQPKIRPYYGPISDDLD